MTNYPPGYIPQIWTINYTGTDFLLVDPKGELHFHVKPKELSKYAWTHGADEVKWDFDLNLDPDK